jgi:hypothetical protein
MVFWILSKQLFQLRGSHRYLILFTEIPDLPLRQTFFRRIGSTQVIDIALIPVSGIWVRYCPNLYFFTGVLVVQPSRQTFEDMMSKVGSIPSYDGGDTGFLNGYFPNWFLESPDSRLPFGYNALRTMHWMTR